MYMFTPVWLSDISSDIFGRVFELRDAADEAVSLRSVGSDGDLGRGGREILTGAAV